MTEKSQKQKNTSQILMLFQQRNCLLSFTYESNHPKRIDIDQFSIGKIKLFTKDKVYGAELKSKPFLNPSLIWTADTFELMIEKFNQFVIQQQTIDLNEQISLCLYIKVKSKLINFLKIKLTEQFGIDLQNQLWNQFQKYNDFKSKHFNQFQNIFEQLNESIQLSLDRLEKVQDQQTQKIIEFKTKLSALMAQKQKKIRQLSGNHLYQWTNDELNRKNQPKPQGFQPSISNWMSSQDDRVLVGSLFAPSQDFLI